MTLERVLEAYQMAEAKAGDNVIPYLQVTDTSMVPQEYKVSKLPFCAQFYCERE